MTCVSQRDKVVRHADVIRKQSRKPRRHVHWPHEYSSDSHRRIRAATGCKNKCSHWDMAAVRTSSSTTRHHVSLVRGVGRKGYFTACRLERPLPWDASNFRSCRSTS